MASQVSSPTILLINPTENNVGEPVVKKSPPPELNRTFKCTVCYDEFPELIYLQRHYLKHINNKPYKCSQCEKSFFRESALESHSALHSDKRHSFVENPLLNKINHKLICNACSVIFFRKQLLHRHERSHTSLQPNKLCYPCVVCGFQFVYKRDLEEHVNSHRVIKQYTCDDCDKSFFFSYLLLQHRRTHYSNESCNVCKENFHNKVALMDHEKTHVKSTFMLEKGLFFACELCDLQFMFQTELETHYNNDHSGDRYQCNYCTKTFFFYYFCLKHKFQHKELRKFKCEVCFNSFKSLQLLSVHSELHQDKKHACPICGKKFSSLYRVQRHSIVHTTQKPYQCNVCFKRFSRQPNLKRHVSVHLAQKEFQCDKCNASYTRKKVLRDHMKMHSDLFPQLPCKHCEKTFVNRSNLMSHIRKEHPRIKLKQSFICDICGKVFQHAPNFDKHYRLHTGERQYKCEYCDKGFIQKNHLRAHFNFHHPGLSLTLPYKCMYCREAYIAKKPLHIHLKKYHSEMVFQDVIIENVEEVVVSQENIN